jgi:hypothetical protein
VRVHLREAEIRHRRRLKEPDRVGQTNLAGAKLLQKLDGIRGCHNPRKIHQGAARSRWKWRAGGMCRVWPYKKLNTLPYRQNREIFVSWSAQ